jgi:hypothetical protein
VLDGMPRDVLAYRRADQGSQALVLLNMGISRAKVNRPAAEKPRRVLWGSRPRAGEALTGDRVNLAGNEALILVDY